MSWHASCRPLAALLVAGLLAAADLSTTLIVDAQASDGSPLVYTWRTLERPFSAGEPEFLPAATPGQVVVRLPRAQPGRYGFSVHLATDGLEADGGTAYVTVRAAATAGPAPVGAGDGGGGGGGCGAGTSLALFLVLALGVRRREAP